MAMAGVVGLSLVEVYAMRAMHKEKMKKLEKQKASKIGSTADDEKEIPSGCFFWVSKKSHSAKVSSAGADSDHQKLQSDDQWSCKS
ncbi:hypothetical protein CUMW_061230 [Citrus unshiu]|uniref:Uncharacterized protein n=1 Tax=Citrus unshiu TaxID=55188 RepID=A0A2H5NPQ9_CITUN|nr:hypothetical protein CUMW_061230 [Citrus unshiu]